MTDGNAELFDVFHWWCVSMRPEAKHKLVVVVAVAPEYMLGFVINSRLNEFVQTRAHLLPCHALVLCAEHPSFLEHDLFVDCQTPYTFPHTNLTTANYRDPLRSVGRAAVLEAVRLCSVLKPVHKKLILGASIRAARGAAPQMSECAA